MYNSTGLIDKFHDEHINLGAEQRKDMQRRRDVNLDRLKNGLEELKKPAIVDTINQGGNAMQTMTQQPESDVETRYDIDVGVVFEAGSVLTPATTKGWVRDAIAKKASNLKSEPEAKKKCVRVVYAEGYQCDFPVLKRTNSNNSYKYHIAIGDEWIDSDPKAVNRWFEDEVAARSPKEEGSSRQLRRIARFIKYFAKVHAYRTSSKFPAGLKATALAVESYYPSANRDDVSLYRTLKAISERSEYAALFANGRQISDSKDVDRLRRIKAAASDAIAALDKLYNDENSASEEDALKAWKKVFRHSFFESEEARSSLNKLEMRSADAVASPALIRGVSVDEKYRRAEEAARRATASGVQTKPWSR